MHWYDGLLLHSTISASENWGWDITVFPFFPGQYYRSDQLLNIYTFSLLRQWLEATPSQQPGDGEAEPNPILEATAQYALRILEQCDKSKLLSKAQPGFNIRILSLLANRTFGTQRSPLDKSLNCVQRSDLLLSFIAWLEPKVPQDEELQQAVRSQNIISLLCREIESNGTCVVKTNHKLVLPLMKNMNFWPEIPAAKFYRNSCASHKHEAVHLLQAMTEAISLLDCVCSKNADQLKMVFEHMSHLSSTSSDRPRVLFPLMEFLLNHSKLSSTFKWTTLISVALWKLTSAWDFIKLSCRWFSGARCIPSVQQFLWCRARCKLRKSSCYVWHGRFHPKTLVSSVLPNPTTATVLPKHFEGNFF